MTADLPKDMVAVLREALAALPAHADPTEEPPSSVYDGATWVHEWINMEAELAELTFDSDERVELAGVRATGLLRELTFVAEQCVVEIEIEPVSRLVTVSGTVDPPTGGRVHLVVGGEVATGDLDSVGSFVIEGVPHGTVLAYVETEAGTVRLGSFEI